MPETLFPDSEIPTAPTLGPAATRERIVAVMLKENLYSNSGKKLSAVDLGNITDLVLSALPQAGLEVSDRGRVADFKACLADWLRLAADNEACGEESVDFEELKARTRRLIGGKS
jgi:hypothetical protein